MSPGPDAAATVNERPGRPGAPAPVGQERPGSEPGRYADEPQLVEAVRRGDRSAFGELAEAYMGPAYAVALSLLRSEQDAEDAVQAAFIRSLERIGQLRPGSPFGPWFYRVLRSTCLNLRRREALRSHEELPPAAAGSSDPERELERRGARERVLAALDRLPEMQRLAVLLYDLEGYSHGEISEILGVAAGTSRANLHHGRRALREILGADVGGSDAP